MQGTHQKGRTSWISLTIFERGKIKRQKQINIKGISCLGEPMLGPIFKPEATSLGTERAQIRLKSHLRPWRANHRPDGPN